MPPEPPPRPVPRPHSTLLTILLLWIAFYASFTLFTPPLLDDADSVHAEVAREMLLRHDYVTLYANGIRYLEKAPLLYWSMALSMRVSQLIGATSPRALAVAARIPLSLTLLALALLVEAFARRLFHSTRAGFYAALITLSSFGLFIFSRILLPDADVCLWTTLALYFFWLTEELGSISTQTQTPSSRPDTEPTHTPPSRPEAAARSAELSSTPTQTPSSRPDAELTNTLSSRPKAEGRSGETRSSALHRDHPAIPLAADQVPRGFSLGSHSPEEKRGLQPPIRSHRLRLYTSGFAIACALNVFSKGLIGVVFPVAIVALYLVLTRGLRGTLHRLRELHLLTALAVFLTVAAPWHILAGLANPTQGHPAPFLFAHGHWQVPLPTDGNVHGWYWFYFMNEHLLRYLNLRVPHDYDTSPLWLFWGLCLIWLMPWSAFAFNATAWAAPLFGRSSNAQTYRTQLRTHTLPLERQGTLLLLVWAAFVLLFFALSTRQEYYVLPALPAAAILIAAWLAQASFIAQPSSSQFDPTSAPSSSQLDPTNSPSSSQFDPTNSPASSQRVPTTPPSARPERSAVERPLYSASSDPSHTLRAAIDPVPRGFSLGSHIPAENRGFSPREMRAALRITTLLLALGTLFAAFATYILLHAHTPPPHTDLATLLTEHPSDYALSMGHFLDLDTRALGLFRLPLTLAALSLFLGPLASLILRRRAQPHAANLALAASAFGFLLAAHLGLQTFAPTLTSAQLAQAIAPQVQPNDLICIHGEYEAGSTLAFYLRRPSDVIPEGFAHQIAPATNFIHILDGRSSNLWYGSFFPDAPAIFETRQTLAEKWQGPQRIFLWQDIQDEDQDVFNAPGPVYILVKSGGKEIVSNQPNR